MFSLKPCALQVARIIHHIRIDSAQCRHFAQTVAVGRIGGTDHNDDVALFRQLFDGGLPVGCRIADIFFTRIADIGETRVQCGNDVFGFIDRERGLADIGKLVGVFDFEFGNISDRFHQKHFPGFELPHRSFDLDMTFMPDHDDFAVQGIEAGNFLMHFRNQRASRIKYPETTFRRFLLHCLRYAVCRINQRRALRYFRQIIDKHRTFFAQVIDDKLVMDDFMTHINRCAELFQSTFDNTDCPIHTGAEAARIGKDDGFSVHNSRIPFSGGSDVFFPVFAVDDIVENRQYRTDTNKAVCNIKGRIKPILPVKQQEIDHMAVNQAIDDIAQRTADNHRRTRFSEGCKLVTQNGAYQINTDCHSQQ